MNSKWYFGIGLREIVHLMLIEHIDMFKPNKSSLARLDVSVVLPTLEAEAGG